MQESSKKCCDARMIPGAYFSWFNVSTMLKYAVVSCTGSRPLANRYPVYQWVNG